MGANMKSRLLTLLDILNSETDEENQITIAKMIERLATKGFTATRKTVVNDIETLISHDIDIICNKGKENLYFIGNRIFELAELTLLVDAIQARSLSL
jgi:hypothetical protein